jgi:hypothetical protein
LRHFIMTFVVFLLARSGYCETTVTQNLLSPMTTSAAPVFWTGTFVTTLSLIFEDQVSDPSLEKTVHRKPLGDA